MLLSGELENGQTLKIGFADNELQLHGVASNSDQQEQTVS
jgi:hypothetical protein